MPSFYQEASKYHRGSRITIFASVPLPSTGQLFFSAEVVISRTFQSHRQKHTSENFFTEQLQAAFEVSSTDWKSVVKLVLTCITTCVITCIRSEYNKISNSDVVGMWLEE